MEVWHRCTVQTPPQFTLCDYCLCTHCARDVEGHVTGDLAVLVLSDRGGVGGLLSGLAQLHGVGVHGVGVPRLPANQSRAGAAGTFPGLDDRRGGDCRDRTRA